MIAPKSNNTFWEANPLILQKLMAHLDPSTSMEFYK